MTPHYRGVYRGPGFVKAFFRFGPNHRQRCILYILAHAPKEAQP